MTRQQMDHKDERDKPGEHAAGVLAGVRVVELAGLGPGPFCAMLLADMGADVIRVERPGGASKLGPADVLARGRRIVELDLKAPADRAALLDLLGHAEVLIEGYRPGVMERLGLGPEVCHAGNPGLVYARMTGWGQHGPLSERAGHDINYIAISGALHAIGPAEGPPSVPLNLVGDFGGGGMILAMGILAALVRSRASGQGQVIDAAMSDGSALLTSMMWGFMHAGHWKNARGVNALDGAAHFYTTYECADGKYLSVGSIEPQFYQTLLQGCGLDVPEMSENYRHRDAWQPGRQALAEVFRRKTRDEWCRLFDGQDACVAPVLDWQEARDFEHNRARETFIELNGVTQPAPAPRFDRTPSQARSFVIEEGGVSKILKEWGVQPSSSTS